MIRKTQVYYKFISRLICTLIKLKFVDQSQPGNDIIWEDHQPYKGCKKKTPGSGCRRASDKKYGPAFHFGSHTNGTNLKRWATMNNNVAGGDKC